MGKSGMAKLSQAIEKVENYFINRKDRKQALKEARTEYKDLVNAIKNSKNPSDFLKTDNTKQEEKQEATKTEKVKVMAKTIFFKQEKFDFQKVKEILELEIEKYQSPAMTKYGDIGIRMANKGKSDNLAKKVNQKKRALKKYGLHLETFEKSLNKGAVIN